MNAFFEQFGIDWKLFVSQLFNFALILVILRIFVYKPLIKALKDRKEKIEQGLLKAEEASVRLKEVDQIAKNKLKDADAESVAVLQKTEEKRKQIEAQIVIEAKKKEDELLLKAEILAKDKGREMEKNIQKQAGEIIRSAMAKAINEAPEQIDDKLIKSAVSKIEER